jgi:L-rhamnose mutarotase
VWRAAVKCFAFTRELRNNPKAIAAYQQYHRNVWPEIEHTQRRLGVKTIKIFLRGQRLFLSIETTDEYDPERAFAEYMRGPKVVEWERLMEGVFEKQLPEAQGGEWWLPMETVYTLE